MNLLAASLKKDFFFCAKAELLALKSYNRLKAKFAYYAYVK